MIRACFAIVALGFACTGIASAQETPAEGSAVQSSMQQAARPSEAEKKTFEDELRRLMDSVQSSKAPVPKRDRTAGSGSGTPMRGPSEADATSRITDIFRKQLLDNKCWVQPAEAPPDGERFDVIINVKFNRKGRFSEGPVLMTPPAMPAGNPPLQAFIRRAFDALKTCEAIGFRVPPQYFADSRWIQMRFLSGF